VPAERCEDTCIAAIAVLIPDVVAALAFFPKSSSMRRPQSFGRG
jgi:hypothetical protein